MSDKMESPKILKVKGFHIHAFIDGERVDVVQANDENDVFKLNKDGVDVTLVVV